MHGRLKVKSSAEQLEAKKKEREKKLQLYTFATSKIFSKKKSGEFDEEMLHLCGEVLTVNPDFYTLWNCRKEVFEKLQHSESKSRLQTLLESELHFLENCLKTNPKSYGTWHHRCYVMETIPEPDWARELDLCNQFLKYDERNFHCWDYRRFIVKKAKISPEAELEFSMSKISNNFSNYSSWHYRSKLLPVVYTDTSQPMGVSETALLKEFELVQNGVFTDPDDQSNWFYHRWLMGRGECDQAINSLLVSRSDQTIIVSFQKPVQVGERTQILLLCNKTRVEDVDWLNQDKKKRHSCVWIGTGIMLPAGLNCCLHVQLITDGVEVCSRQLQVGPEGSSTSKQWLPNSGSSRFSPVLSCVKSDTLQQELESVIQLMEVEPNNKWAVLTAVVLMKALDPVKHKSEIIRFLEMLENLDEKRRGYFRDLRSKFLMELALDSAVVGASDDAVAGSQDNCLNGPECQSFNLIGQDLSRLYYPELLTLVTRADFSNNKLRDVQQFRYLISVRELRLSYNCITTCDGLHHLPHLEMLYINNNLLTSSADVSSLQSCPRLQVLDLSGNPLTQQTQQQIEEVKQLEKVKQIEEVKQMFPQVHLIV